jgi:putative phosphoribosyl transferase
VQLLLGAHPQFADRRDAGQALAAALEGERGHDLVVVGLARGGVEVAAEVARALEAPLDVVAVRKIGHPWQPEYALGAVAPGDGVFVRAADGLSEEQLAGAVEATKANAAALDRRLHHEQPALELGGKTVILVDDGLATGATMIAALRWAKGMGATRVVAAVPVAAARSLASIAAEATEVVCLHAPEEFFAVGAWYRSFGQVEDADVIRLVAANRAGRRLGLPSGDD